MSEFKELIKSFNKTRDYVRDFFVYGFKTREDFTGKSIRTYDNERRRIESWLGDYVKQDYSATGKNIHLSIDSNLLDTNPLYRVWKAKSFTDNDVNLHFFILDTLSCDDGYDIETLTDMIDEKYDCMYDSQIIRRKCNAYVKEGLVRTKKFGKELLYFKSESADLYFSQFCELTDAICFFQLGAPLGIIGNTILDNINETNSIFRVKHSFFVHTLEDEILFELLKAMNSHKEIELTVKSTKNDNLSVITGVPLKIFTSTRTGRRFLCYYEPDYRRFTTSRMDSIKEVKPLNVFDDYELISAKLNNNLPKVWGVSFNSYDNLRIEHIKITLHINEYREQYILTRLESEGRGGTITKIADNTFTYENDIFDSNEITPWVRTFIGRIIDIECTSKKMEQKFKSDLETMFKMYEI
ncbi:MAG: WYL domain-containing protein [Lachnospiraceae bacterium]|nr:WYL domain-containing protein [Lachnospiraceae bacterium]